MRIARGLGEFPPGPSVLALGTFDGVHLGHGEVIGAAVARARAGGRAVAVTFEPHPLEVLHPGPEPLLLTTLDERAALLSHLGIDVVLVLPFDSAFSRTPAQVWMDDILATRLGAEAIFVGSSYTFGHDREGTAERLVTWGRARAIEIVVVPAVVIGGKPVNSTRIRTALREGLVDEAARLLGRRYSLRGRVIAGDGRGRTIGYPTANLAPDSSRKILPGAGVYATIAAVGDRRYAGATNIGRRPTFGGGELSVETHLLEFSGTLTGQALTLEFVRRIREERRFQDPAALVRQIGQDVSQIRELLVAAGPGYTVVVDREHRNGSDGAHGAPPGRS